MKILNLVQGSPEWNAHRATAKNASDAPAMLGFSKYKTRNELLKEKATGLIPGVDAATQKRFDDGHESEALARPKVEALIGEELYPATATDGHLSASYDGITMLQDVVWENKLYNKELEAYINQHNDLPDTHWPQVEQQLIIAKEARCVFTLCDKNGDIILDFTYHSIPERCKQVLAGWKQFDIDLENYQHRDVQAEVVAAPVKQLPALSVELTGDVKNSNLVPYKEAVLARIKAINTDFQTDQDFADAEAAVKFLNNAEKEIETVKKMALAQTASIDELFRTVDHLREEMRTKRLELDKLVKTRKESIRYEIQQEAANAFLEHIEQINQTLGGKIRLPQIPADFAGVMKGKKTVSSLRDSVDTELARVKIESNQVADRLRINLDLLRTNSTGYEFLFSDAQQILLKDKEDLQNLIALRISEHKAKEEQKPIANEPVANVPTAPIKKPELVTGGSPSGLGKQSPFENWWQSEGKLIAPVQNEPSDEYLKRIGRSAFEAGLIQAARKVA